MFEQSSTAIRSFQLGWIPYWNLHPHRVELSRQKNFDFKWVTGHPTEINRQLGEGTILCAPASAISVLLNPNMEIAAPIGVACNGPVQSVYLGIDGETTAICEIVRQRLALAKDILKDALDDCGSSFRRAANLFWQELDASPGVDPRLIPKLKLTAASASGAVLSKVFYKILFGKAAFESMQRVDPVLNPDAPTLELVIGDEALARRHEFKKVFDLGQLWKHISNLPFVFAVLQKGPRPVPESIIEVLTRTAHNAEAKMHIEPCSYFPNQMPMCHDGSEIDLAAFWKCINYRLGAREMQGLLLYLCLARSLVRAEMDDAMVVKMLRWQQIAVDR